MPNWKTLTMISLMAAGLPFSGTDARAQTPAIGTFTLATVNGQALPVVTETTSDCREELLSGAITLEADGDWAFEYAERETCGSEVDEDEEREGGDYTPDGQTVRFSDDTDDFEPDDLDIDELGAGALSAEGLTVTLQDGRTVLLFRR